MSAVAEHLEGRGVAFELVPHDQTYTSVDEARALGIAADEVIKSIALKTSTGYVLAAVPAARRLDMKLVREAAGDKHARLATEDELERDFPQYELGGLPPLGSLLDVHVYVDPEVMQHETVVFAAGSQTESVKIRREDLFRDEPVTVAALTQHPEEGEKELFE